MKFRMGEPRFFLPVCVLTPLGFIGGPSGYREVSAREAEGAGFVVLLEADLVDHASSDEIHPSTR